MYKQSSEDRHYIEIQHKSGDNPRQIIKSLGRSHSIIAREIDGFSLNGRH